MLSIETELAFIARTAVSTDIKIIILNEMLVQRDSMEPPTCKQVPIKAGEGFIYAFNGFVRHQESLRFSLEQQQLGIRSTNS